METAEEKAARLAAEAEAGAAGEEINIGDLSTEEIRAKVEAGELTVQQVVDYTNEMDAEHKTSLEAKDKTILDDRLKKIDKAKSKIVEKTEEPQELEVEDLLTLREQKFAKDSEEAELLKRYREAGLIDSYESGLTDTAVKAKLAEIKATRDAADEIDENADQDVILQSKNIVVDGYNKTGKEPETDYEKGIVVEEGLKSAGFKEY